jgi:hypothetical protein
LEEKLDLLAAVLLEGLDDLPDRLVLLGSEPFFPPHHEVGGMRAERSQIEGQSKYESTSTHINVSSNAVSSKDWKRSARRYSLSAGW